MFLNLHIYYPVLAGCALKPGNIYPLGCLQQAKHMVIIVKKDMFIFLFI